MNIQILDSWLKEHIETGAKPPDISKCLSLSSVSVERMEKTDSDYLYDIEITTNRADLMSIAGIARELSAVLPQYGFKARLIEESLRRHVKFENKSDLLEIKMDESLVNRVTAVVMEVKANNSPDFIKNRLEKSDIRSLNNLIDITNYIMREVGHPAHVFDLDRLNTKKLIIRASRSGETITTLDEKTHVLKGGDIVAEDERGRIVDLLGIMGLKNSVVTDKTSKILLFLDNNNPQLIRKTSLALGIRSEAAILNEKGVDPELITPTILKGIELYEKYANGKVVGNILDIYPNKPEIKKITARKKRISDVIGVDIDEKTLTSILENLSFEVENAKDIIRVTVPSFRVNDVRIEEDIIEEVARVYGYHKIPVLLPPIKQKKASNLQKNKFYWENRVKDAFKYWGFNEVYTYSMISENLFEGPIDTAVKILNPLSEEHVFMRRTLIPSLLEVVRNNYSDNLMLFEIANVYLKKKGDLPEEVQHLAGVIKKNSNRIFFEAKGIIEQLFNDLGIESYAFKNRSEGGAGADVFIKNRQVGDIEFLEEGLVNFELHFENLISFATMKKVYKPIPEYPPVIEDIRVEAKKEVPYEKIVFVMSSQSNLVSNVELFDEYENKMTFRITYQDRTKSLSNEDVTPIREKIISALKTKLKAKVG